MRRHTALAATILAATIATGCDGLLSTDDGCNDLRAAAPVFIPNLFLEVRSSTTTFIVQNGKCAAPLIERQTNGQWETVETIWPFTCGCGVEICPGPIPTSHRFLAVAPQMSQMLQVPLTQIRDGGSLPLTAGRYRFTVPYCRTKAECAQFMPSLPETKLCGATHSETVEVDVLAGQEAMAVIELIP